MEGSALKSRSEESSIGRVDRKAGLRTKIVLTSARTLIGFCETLKTP